MALPFECQVCMENTIELHSKIRTVDGSRICFDRAVTAIVPLFKTAMKNEIEYPPRWGSHAIPFEDFQDLLSPETCERWFTKLAEYRTPVARRVHCGRKKQGTSAASASANENCNYFLGATNNGRYA